MKKKWEPEDAYRQFLERNPDLDGHSHFKSVLVKKLNKRVAVRDWNPQCCHCEWGRAIFERMWKEYFE